LAVNRFAFLGKRLLQVIPLLIGMTLVTFLILQLVPADPAQAMAGPRATPQLLAELRDRLGLDEPLVQQYLQFLGGVAQFDFGISWRTQSSVTSVIGARYGVSLWLVGTTLVLTVLVSIPLAAVAAVYRGRGPDVFIRFASMFGLGLPSFWIGIMLIVLVAVPTGLFPVGGSFGETPFEHLRAVFLPAVALTVTLAPIVIRSLRTGLVGALESDYVAAARSIGASGTGLVMRHVLRNSVVPTVSLLGVMVGYLSFGTVVLEQAFDLPGLGQTMVQASLQRDYPVVLALTLVFGFVVVIMRLLADVAIVLIDPRVEMD
jgi:peptide/nickel transport system permease protein